MKRLHKKRTNVYVIATVIVMLAYIAVIVMLGCLIGLFAELINTGYERDDFETVVCLVAYGDTAWSFARRYCPEGLDYRKYLDWCAKENGMSDMGSIHYGRSYVFLKLK